MSKYITKDSLIVLTNANDFYTWNREFQSKAVSLDLWDYLDPNVRIPWPKRPVMPDVSNYPKALTTPSTSTRSSTAVDHETIDVDPPRSIMEMTATGRAAYTADSNNYNARIREYSDHVKTVNQLKNWVLETVSRNYKDTKLQPTATLDEWYEELCSIGTHLQGSLMHQARNDYRQFIDASAKRPPKDLGAWATEWEGKLALAIMHGAKDLKESYNQVTDLDKALGATYPEWITSFRQINRSRIKEGTLDYTETAAALREEAGFRLAAKPKPKGTLHKGAFPTYGHTDEAEDEIEVEMPTPPTSDRRRGSTPRGRPRGRGNSKGGLASSGKRPRTDTIPTSNECKLCLQFHPLDKCWYIFSDLATENWIPNPVVQKMIQRRIEEDLELAKEIDRIRQKKTKTSDQESRKD